MYLFLKGNYICPPRFGYLSPRVPLHCPSARLSAARSEAWEERDPGGVRILLANPGWERRLLRFLELSGVGRVEADGSDEDEVWARKMDDWIIWEGGGGSPETRTQSLIHYFSLFSAHLSKIVRGTYTPRYVLTAQC
jgi:hypothetical protein